MNRAEKGRLLERRVEGVMRGLGYEVTPTSVTCDGGVDVIVGAGNGRMFVQCKNMRTACGVTVARELYGVMSLHSVDCGMLVSSNGFTDDCEAFAQASGVRLVDGGMLAVVKRMLAAGMDREVILSVAPEFAPGVDMRAAGGVVTNVVEEGVSVDFRKSLGYFLLDADRNGLFDVNGLIMPKGLFFWMYQDWCESRYGGVPDVALVEFNDEVSSPLVSLGFNMRLSGVPYNLRKTDSSRLPDPDVCMEMMPYSRRVSQLVSTGWVHSLGERRCWVRDGCADEHDNIGRFIEDAVEAGIFYGVRYVPKPLLFAMYRDWHVFNNGSDSQLGQTEFNKRVANHLVRLGFDLDKSRTCRNFSKSAAASAPNADLCKQFARGGDYTYRLIGRDGYKRMGNARAWIRPKENNAQDASPCSTVAEKEDERLAFKDELLKLGVAEEDVRSCRSEAM